MAKQLAWGLVCLWAGASAASEPVTGTEEFHLRNQWIDAVLSADPPETPGGIPVLPLRDLLPTQQNSIAWIASDPVDFHTNPEPSSILVWSTIFSGLSAAGYGVRHRQEPAAAH